MVGELHAPFPLRDVHGIACFDNRLWVTCSFDNMVAIYDFRLRQWSQWYPAPNPADRGRDVHHFNTIRFVNNKLCLVAHCFGRVSSGFMTTQACNFIMCCRWGNGPRCNRVSRGCCDVQFCGRLHCERLRPKVYTGGFPRGVGLTAAGNLVGISIRRSTRAERAGKDAFLKWYSPDWQFRADLGTAGRRYGPRHSSP